MVGSATSLGRNGIHDWLLQRVSAVVIAAYVFYAGGFVFANPNMSFEVWQQFMGSLTMKVFSAVTLLFIVVHGWIGLWTVGTDYLKPTGLRLVYQVIVILSCLTLFVWGLVILWGF